MPDQYPDPVTLDRAKARRAELANVLSSIQRQLIASPDHDGRRAAAKVKKSHIEDELRWLKAWMVSYHSRHQTALVGGTDWQTMRAKSACAFSDLLSYLDGLIAELAGVREENTALRARVAELESATPVAPGSGVDEWRDQL